MLTLKQKSLWARRVPYVAAGVALLMTVLCHSVLYRPVAQRLAGMNERIALSRAELDAARIGAAELPKLERDVEQLRQKMQASHRLPEHQDWGQFIREVTTFGEASALSKFTVQPGVPQNRELVSRVPVSLSFEGDYVSACAFLHRIEEMPRLTTMNGLSVHAVDPTVGRVEVQFSMNLYFADSN